MLGRIIESMTSDDDLVLDFFAGSGSTAHAVLDRNRADGGRRRCISVNIPEPIDEDSQAHSVGYKTVCDIAIARIKKVMGSIEGGHDQGLRIFTLDQSNFRADVSGYQLDLSDSTLVREGAAWQAIASEVLIKEGVALDEQWQRHAVGDVEVVVADGVAVALSDKVDNTLVEGVLKLDVRVVVFLEDGFADADAVKANAVTNAKNLGITLKTV